MYNFLGWCNCSSAVDLIKDLIKELQAYEGLTWQQVRQKSEHNHPWKFHQLSKGLRDRLSERGLELPELFQIELGNRPRIWGYKEIGIFYLMWYDPKHKGCEVKIK